VNLAFALLGSALWAAPAAAQEAVVTRRGDGTVVLPSQDGEIVITTRTQGPSGPVQIPRRAGRLKEKELDRFIRDRAGRGSEWT
jgi:hypothetical protein